MNQGDATSNVVNRWTDSINREYLRLADVMEAVRSDELGETSQSVEAKDF